MKNIQKVWAEITAKKAEVALSKEKLKLSALDDIKESRQILERDVRDADEIEGTIKMVQMQIDEVGSVANGALSDLEYLIGELRDDYETAERALDEYESLANDLGINANESEDWEDLRVYLTNDFEDAQSKLQDYYGLLDDLTTALRNL